VPLLAAAPAAPAASPAAGLLSLPVPLLLPPVVVVFLSRST
jgi:hypothetical protein